MKQMDSSFPPILVINLNDRTDRWTDIQNDFSSWNVPIERVEGVKESPGQIGCWKSHQKCLQIAKERGYPWVLILEDDCLPAPDGKERFLELLPSLWEKREEWDIFNGGAEIYQSSWILRIVQRYPPLFHVKAIMTHFILVPQRMYDTILETTPATTAIDFYYMNNYRIWCTVPHIAIQKPGKSDVGNADDNRDLLEKSTTFLKEFLHNEAFQSFSREKYSNYLLQHSLYIYDTKTMQYRFVKTLIVGSLLLLSYCFLRKAKRSFFK